MTAGSEPVGSPVIVITGASSGIGRATARAFARRGAAVVLCARGEPGLWAAEAECRADGARATLVVVADVLDGDAMTGLAAVAVDRSGRVDVWVHTAAVVAYGRFEDVPPAVFDRVVTTGVLGSANAARAALATFRGQGEIATLVLFGSLLGQIVTPYMSSYVTSKWGVRGLARLLQVETRDAKNIHVCVLTPGGVNTPVYRQAANYAGRTGRPPPPVDPPDKVARKILALVDRPQRRSVGVGPANGVTRLGFVALPAVFDTFVGPLMRGGGLTREPVEPHEGNVFTPTPAGDAGFGEWGRHRLGNSSHMPPTRKTVLTAAGPVQQSVVSRLVTAPLDQVWSVLADGWTWAGWVVGASRIRDVDPSWPAPGARIHHSVGVWPALINDSTEVVEMRPCADLLLTARAWPAGEAQVRFRLEPDGQEATRVTIEEDATAGPGLLLPGPGRRAMLHVRNVETLRRLALIAQGRAQR